MVILSLRPLADFARVLPEFAQPPWDDCGPIDSFSQSPQEPPPPPPATVECPWCEGAGACDPCYGSGFLPSGFLCPWCSGSGKCHRCGGSGTIPAPGFILVMTCCI